MKSALGVVVRIVRGLTEFAGMAGAISEATENVTEESEAS